MARSSRSTSTAVPTFQALQHRSVKRIAIVFYAFDLLHLGCRLPRTARARPAPRPRGLTFASPLLLSQPLPGTPDEIERVVREAGSKASSPSASISIYEPGRRSHAWVKVKFSQRQEFVIGGYKPAGRTSIRPRRILRRPTIPLRGQGASRVQPSHPAASCSSVSRARNPAVPVRQPAEQHRQSHWGEGITAEDMKTLRWVEPRVVIEVAFTEWTAGNNLRHASFVGLREDKRPRDVHRSS